MSNLPQTGVAEWVGSEASPWNTVNKIARALDAFATRSIIEDRDLTAPPGACADGARYLVKATASGAWLGHDGQLAIAVGANAANGWYFSIVANEGTQLYVRDEGTLIEYLSGVWATSPDRIVANLAGIIDGDILYYDLSNGLFYPAPPPAGIAAYLDTDGTLAANSDLKVATQKATKTYVDSAVVGLLDYKGVIDCSANPNYPAASKGDAYVVSVAGKIGGASGKTVEAGDFVFAKADNAGGTEASVGASWDILQFNATAYALLSGAAFSGAVTVPDDAYSASGWNGSVEVPTKNAVRDKIESLVSSTTTRLQDLTDVDPAGLADGNMLFYDASNGFFYFAMPPGGAAGATRLVDLTDVNTSEGLIDGYTLRYDASSGSFYLAPDWQKDTPVNIRFGPAFTIKPMHSNSVQRLDNPTAITATIDLETDGYEFPEGAFLEIWQKGAGTITVAAAGGVTLNSRGALVASAGQYAALGLRRMERNVWNLTGDLA